MAATSSFALTGWLLNTWGSFPTEREGEEELRCAPSALTRAGWKHHLYAAGEREGRRGEGRSARCRARRGCDFWNTGGMKILVTAFDAFGGESINPTEQALELLPEEVGGAELVKTVIPTKFGESLRRVIALAGESSVDAIVCLGQAGGRKHITPERVAINVMDAEIPDNAGYQPVDVPVVEGGPAAYFSTLPVKEMVAAMDDCPARVSNTAGTFVCNQLLYGLLHHFAGTEVRAGFVHVPYIQEQNKADKPMMALAEIVEGIKQALWAVQAS